MKSEVLFESKVKNVFLILFLFGFLFLIGIGLIIEYWYLGIIFFFALWYRFRKVPSKVRFYEGNVEIKYFLKTITVQYTEIKKIEFHYSSPYSVPVLIIHWSNKLAGFEWGEDKQYLTDMLSFFLSREVKITDPHKLLKNYVNIILEL